MAEVSELRKLFGWNPSQLYDFARVYAVASVKDKKTEYADTAMELLRKAVRAGWRDHAHMRTDAHLDALRERSDFQKLLAELEAKFPPPRAVAPPPHEKQ